VAHTKSFERDRPTQLALRTPCSARSRDPTAENEKRVYIHERLPMVAAAFYGDLRDDPWVGTMKDAIDAWPNNDPGSPNCAAVLNFHALVAKLMRCQNKQVCSQSSSVLYITVCSSGFATYGGPFFDTTCQQISICAFSSVKVRS
jgi:hypothetical protein